MKKEIVKLKKIKTDKKRLQKDCMDLWQQIVKKRANNKCEYWNCHKTNNLNAHHVFSRSRGSTKYDIDNGIALCSGHHSLLIDSAHKDPEFLIKILGEIDGYTAIRTKLWYQRLRLKANTPAKLDLSLEKLYLEKELWKLEQQELMKPYHAK